MEKTFTNEWFITQLKESFKDYLNAGTSRSTKKLVPLHKAFAQAINDSLTEEEKITIKSQGLDDNKEGTITGKYAPKKVDITVYKDGKPIAGYAIKFVMRNYSQNIGNYFDSMLGETVNIRSNNIPYFQVLILFDTLPYFDDSNKIDHWEDFTNSKKDKFLQYEILSKDDPSQLVHVPNKMLLYILHLKDNEKEEKDPETGKTTTISDRDKLKTFQDYKDYYLPILDNEDTMVSSEKIDKSKFNDTVIVNDFENFIFRSSLTIRGKLK